MSLDIGIANAKTMKPYPAMSFSFDDDGYYWFCYPFFEKLQRETGEMIDLYGGAWFEGTQLDVLAKVLEEIAAAARAMPAQWEWEVPPPFRATVRRAVLLKRLAQFQALVRKARNGSKWIACFGD